MNWVQRQLNKIGGGRKDHTISLTSRNTSFFGILDNFFNFSFGGGNFEKYVEAFGQNPLVYMIVNKIAVKESSLPRMVIDSNGNEVENSQIKEILSKPNPSQFELDFRINIAQTLMSTGNCFIWAREITGLRPDLIILQSEKVDINVDKVGVTETVVSYTYTKDETEVTIDAEDVLHIKTVNIVNTKEEGVHYGFSPLESAFNLVKSSEEIFAAEAAIFKNRGVIGLLSNETDVPLLDKARKALQEQLDEDLAGAHQFNRIKITNSKLKYLQMGMSPTDLKLLDGILNKLRLLCSVYGLNSVLFNDQVASTFDNVAEANRSAHIDVYIPLGKKIDQNLSAFLSEKLKVKETIVIDENKIDVLKQINKDLSDAVVDQFEKLIIDRDEARDTLGYKPEEN
jgi:HK97 family phage portal protein